jgi:hypothetical protein
LITTLTALQVVNRALTEIAQGPALASGTPSTGFDGTPTGVYAGILYPGAVQMLLRQQDPEFARRVVALTLSGQTAPQPWSYEYVYPTNCVRIRQVSPPTWDEFDPQPVYWEEGFNATSSQVVIWANEATALLTYTTNAVTEGDFDDGFTEVLVRYLGSQLSMPVAGRPDLSREFLDVSGRLGAATMDRDS